MNLKFLLFSTLILTLFFSAVAQAEKCSHLSHQFCERLWSAENEGNLTLNQGQILQGTTETDAISHASRKNYEAYVDAFSRLPDHLKSDKGSALVAKIKGLLDKEEDTKEWHRTLSKTIRKLNDEFDDLTHEKLYQKYPELRDLKLKDRTPEQQALVAASEANENNYILEAKYKEHPNWKRVERLFHKAQADIVEAIQAFRLDLTTKGKLTQRIKTIRLVLPYNDTRIITQMNNCGSTLVNAFYSPGSHSFTVCAGYFNTFQSDSALYFVIAHELSHSIDPKMIATLEFLESDLSSFLGRISEVTDSPMSCPEWKQSKVQLFPELESIQARPNIYSELSECLVPKKNLIEFNLANLRKATDPITEAYLSSYASSHYFTTLAQPTVTKKGVTEANPFYLKPQLYYSKLYNYLPPQSEKRFAAHNAVHKVMFGLFTQSLLCQHQSGSDPTEDPLPLEVAPQETKNKYFEQAIQDVKKMYQSWNEQEYSYCGDQCPGLVNFRLSRNTQEQFADWLATRAFLIFLKSLPTPADQEILRENTVLAGSLFCEAPSVQRDAPDFARIEKTFSKRPHPVSRSRRLAVFTKEIAELVQCELDDEIKKLNIWECTL